MSDHAERLRAAARSYGRLSEFQAAADYLDTLEVEIGWLQAQVNSLGLYRQRVTYSTGLVCNWSGWRVIDDGHLGLELPAGNFCDMNGAIAAAQALCPGVWRIDTFVAGALDTIYMNHAGDWQALEPRELGARRASIDRERWAKEQAALAAEVVREAAEKPAGLRLVKPAATAPTENPPTPPTP